MKRALTSGHSQRDHRATPDRPKVLFVPPVHKDLLPDLSALESPAARAKSQTPKRPKTAPRAPHTPVKGALKSPEVQSRQLLASVKATRKKISVTNFEILEQLGLGQSSSVFHVVYVMFKSYFL